MKRPCSTTLPPPADPELAHVFHQMLLADGVAPERARLVVGRVLGFAPAPLDPRPSATSYVKIR